MIKMKHFQLVVPKIKLTLAILTKLFEQLIWKNSVKKLLRIWNKLFICKNWRNKHNLLIFIFFSQGLSCLHHQSQCFGDYPDAVYFGLHIWDYSDQIETLTLQTDHEMHAIHRYLNASTYSSLYVLKRLFLTLSKNHMQVHATWLGIAHFQFSNINTTFGSWDFTAKPDYCARILQISNYGNADSEQISTVNGCTMIMEHYLSQKHYMTYCERVHLNPITTTGLDWNNIIPVKFNHIGFRDWKKLKTTNEIRSIRSFVCSHLFTAVSTLCHVWWHRTTYILTHFNTGGEASNITQRPVRATLSRL